MTTPSNPPVASKLGDENDAQRTSSACARNTRQHSMLNDASSAWSGHSQISRLQPQATMYANFPSRMPRTVVISGPCLER
eukprot:6918872-Prymnesium_polylepis.3